MRILVVDDNTDALAVIENFLKALDHQVTSCTSGMEALLWLDDFKPQVIIADLQMPEMDGFEFIRQVRYRSAHASTPVICITGTDLTDEQISAHGFTAILRKPITLSELMTALEDIYSALRASGDGVG